MTDVNISECCAVDVEAFTAFFSFLASSRCVAVVRKSLVCLNVSYWQLKDELASSNAINGFVCKRLAEVFKICAEPHGVNATK